MSLLKNPRAIRVGGQDYCLDCGRPVETSKATRWCRCSACRSAWKTVADAAIERTKRKRDDRLRREEGLTRAY